MVYILVVAVTERLESSSNEGIIDSTTNKINLLIDELGSEDYENEDTTIPTTLERVGLPRKLNLENSINVLSTSSDSKCWNVQFDCGNTTCIGIYAIYLFYLKNFIFQTTFLGHIFLQIHF